MTKKQAKELASGLIRSERGRHAVQVIAAILLDGIDSANAEHLKAVRERIRQLKVA